MDPWGTLKFNVLTEKQKLANKSEKVCLGNKNVTGLKYPPCRKSHNFLEVILLAFLDESLGGWGTITVLRILTKIILG